MTTPLAVVEQLARVDARHLRNYEPAVRLMHAGFREMVTTTPGLTIYECHAGAFSVQVRHDTDSDTMTPHIAYRAREGGPPMRYRPWSVPTGTNVLVVAEVLMFLKTVDEHPFSGGD